MSPVEPGAATSARFIAEPDDDAIDQRASGFGPHDPPWRVRDAETGRIIEHGFRLEDGALGYAEALNHFPPAEL
jgi:hypothetical protein